MRGESEEGLLRSSAVTEDGRHLTSEAPSSSRSTGCDPRPSRRTAATRVAERFDLVGEMLRSSAVTEDGRHPARVSLRTRVGACCDPRPSRRTAATRWPTWCGRRSRNCCDPRPSRRTAATPVHQPGRCADDAVAILGRHGGRPPHRFTSPVGAPMTQLRSSAVTEDGRHLLISASILSRSTSCDPRPSRRTAATVCSPARRPSSRGCDPRPSRRTAATTISGTTVRTTESLRSSAVTEDGRHTGGERRPAPHPGVAILGRHGGRPPPHQHRASRPGHGVAILGRHGGRPPRFTTPRTAA